MDSLDLTISIFFVDGGQVHLKAVMNADQQVIGGSRIADFLSATQVALEVDGKLHIYPVNSIREIVINPAQPAHSAHIIGGLTHMSVVPSSLASTQVGSH